MLLWVLRPYKPHNPRALDRVFLVAPKSDVKVKGDAAFADNLLDTIRLARSGSLFKSFTKSPHSKQAVM